MPSNYHACLTMMTSKEHEKLDFELIQRSLWMRTMRSGLDEPDEGIRSGSQIGWIRCKPEIGTYMYIYFLCACKDYICK